MLFFKITLCIIVLLTILLSIPFYISAEYKKNAFNNYAEVKLKVLGFKLKLIPNDKKPEEPVKKKKEKKEKAEDTEKEDFLEKFKIKFDNWLDAFNAVKWDIANILDYLAGKLVRVKDLYIGMIFGFDDAAANGIMTGVLNGVVYNILGFAHRHMTIEKWKVNIQPDFYAKRFDAEVRCILRIKPVHIIVVALKVLKMYFKLRRLNKKLKEGKE